jgi:rhodanese-related sulfurtransferase
MENLSQEEWKAKLASTEDAVVLDVRTPQEWSEGIIPKAEKIDFLDSSNFMDNIEKLDKSKSYFIYCRSGNRSGQACQIFDKLGFNASYNLMGGMMDWEGETV